MTYLLLALLLAILCPLALLIQKAFHGWRYDKLREETKRRTMKP